MGTEIGLPTGGRGVWLKMAQKVRHLGNGQKLTEDGDGSPVRQDGHALTDKEARGETHDLFEQVL